jgi:putative tricarboxylic transport membrane protein
MPGQKYGPAWFPGLIAGGLGVCGLFLIIAGARKREPWVVLPAWIYRRRTLAGVAAVVGGLLFYIFAADRLGFHITGIVLLTFWVCMLGASWRVALPVAIIGTLLIHLSFYKLLRIPLPWGLLERWAF